MHTPQSPRIIAVITLVLGLVSTLSLSQYFYATGKNQWQQQAQAEMERISELLVFWLQLAYEPMLGLSMLMQGSKDVTQEEFTEALSLTHQDERSVQRSAYAFVTNVDNEQIVQLSSNDQPLLMQNHHLTTHPAFQKTLQRSQTRPGSVSVGPIFKDTLGLHKVFFAIPTGSQTARGHMVALVDIEGILQDLHVQHVPQGLICLLKTPDLPANTLTGRLPAQASSPIYEHTIEAQLAGQPWGLQWQLFASYLGGHATRLSLVVMITGSLISFLTAFLSFLWLNHRQRAKQLDAAYHALENATKQMIKSEKMASLGSLVAGVAHEMNTPIGNSLTVATALRQKGKEFSQTLQEGTLKKSLLNDFLATLEEATELLENNTRRAAQLVGNFKQVAVDQSSERRRPFDLKQAVDETLWTLEPTLKRTRHKLHVDIPAGIQCDSYPGAIGQILTNLVSNSMQHGFENQAEGHIEIRAAILQGIIHLDYEDDGCGIDPEHINKVFDPFFTTKLGQGGSGLGLHIIYNLVTGLLGGDITMSSTPGQGIHATLHFPATAPVRHDTRMMNG